MPPGYQQSPKTVVISLGGSLICPRGPDISYLKKFQTFAQQMTRNTRLVIIAGGGQVCRNYQEACRRFTRRAPLLDWVGIMSTRLNAQLVAAILGYKPMIVTHPLARLGFSHNLLIAGGWKPGFSSDMDAVLLGKRCQARIIFNLTNQDYVYTHDPKKDPHAKPLKSITWKKYLHLIGPRWTPGLCTPFDPVASRQAQRLGMTVYIINGKRFSEIRKAICGKPFAGTSIHP